MIRTFGIHKLIFIIFIMEKKRSIDYRLRYNRVQKESSMCVMQAILSLASACISRGRGERSKKISIRKVNKLVGCVCHCGVNVEAKFMRVMRLFFYYFIFLPTFLRYIYNEKRKYRFHCTSIKIDLFLNFFFIFTKRYLF